MGNGREMKGKWEMLYIFYRDRFVVNFYFSRVGNGVCVNSRVRNILVANRLVMSCNSPVV